MSAILVVEDDEAIRDLIDVVLTQEGHAVARARNGEQALEMMRGTRFDLVVLDQHMPRMSGLELLETLKRRGRACPPVIMVTANRSVATVQEAQRLGCAGYLAKPFTPDSLKARVRAVLKPLKDQGVTLAI